MKKFYKVALALAIALGSVSAYAAGSAIATPPLGGELNGKAIEIYASGKIISVRYSDGTNADGKKATITAILGNASVTAVVNDGQVEVSLIEGIYIVTVDGVSETVFIKN